jgi:transposase
MARPPMSIVLSEDERRSLKEMVKPTAQHRYAQRARVVLMAADGKTVNEMVRECGLSRVSVCHWKRRFVERRMEGLMDAPRSGRPRIYTHDDVLKVVNTACSKPPEPETHWTVGRIAEASGTGMRKSRVQRILSSLDLKPHRYRMWLFSSDPEFEKKELDVCGLYINPPENSVVLCVD